VADLWASASPQCALSGDGLYIASLNATGVVVRSTETLQIESTVTIPSEVSGSVLSLIWAPSSTRILVASADQIHVMSVSGPSFHGTIRYPSTGSGKPSHMCFGADDSELLVFSSFGLKLLVYDLSASKAIEIAGPKFHLASSAARGFSIRSKTAHMALLTRVGGRDTVSIHNPNSRQVQRSWHPDTVDAQALSWSPDGQWLILWESSAYGRRLLLYTPDGQLFRTIDAPKNADDEQATLKPGLKLCQFSPDSQLCVLCDHSRGVAVLNTAAWREDLTLTHPRAITPSDTLQVRGLQTCSASLWALTLSNE
jgi:WD40 repeat protein